MMKTTVFCAGLLMAMAPAAKAADFEYGYSEGYVVRDYGYRNGYGYSDDDIYGWRRPNAWGPGDGYIGRRPYPRAYVRPYGGDGGYYGYQRCAYVNGVRICN